MKILIVIHGYPPRYNAGSEVYTQLVAQEFTRRGHEVSVFTRQENVLLPDYQMEVEKDPLCPKVTLEIINLPRLRFRSDRYRHEKVDQAFQNLVERFQPDVAYINHLHHLSTSLVHVLSRRSIPILFMLHDYWLLCPRGQLIRMFSHTEELWPLCPGPSPKDCAHYCYAPRHTSGHPAHYEQDLKHWEQWVKERNKHICQIIEEVDLFLAPSKYLKQRFEKLNPLFLGKIQHLPYGFDRSRLTQRRRERKTGAPFVFGYIGRHVPTKGIDLLIRAFAKLAEKEENTELRIFGRPNGEYTEPLKKLVASYPAPVQKKIHFQGEYRNDRIVQEVFNHIDCIVVPSIWEENYPLVIQEALEARVPVIASNLAGMAELIQHEVNGLLFTPRDEQNLARQMERLIKDKELLEKLTKRGYLGSPDGHIPSIEEHVDFLEQKMQELIQTRRKLFPKKLPGPWRITFETNPDTCNLHCIMCECHSPFSRKRQQRIALRARHRLMPIEWVEKTVREAVPYGLREIIPSTMGEPLLYKDFEKIIEICHKYNVKLNLTTNGTFPRLGAAKWAELITPVCSDVKISINGVTPKTQESIMLGSSLEDILDNVRQFIQVRDKISKTTGNHCRVTFQVTFMTLNGEEFPELVRLAASLGVERIKGHHLWVNFPEIAEYSFRHSREKRTRWNEIVQKVYEAREKYCLPNGKKILLENFHPLKEEDGDIKGLTACPFLGKELWLGIEGKWSPCCAPDDERSTLGDFGNIQQKSWKEVWESEEYQHLLATYPTRQVCQKCNMRCPIE